MPTGAITQYIDVAQLTLYLFWIFFAGLIYYLHRENKREGYPLDSERANKRVKVQGWPPVPSPVSYKWQYGRTVWAPHNRDEQQGEIKAKPVGKWPGAPLQPTGNPMLDNVGPGSYTQRDDIADVTCDGVARIVPLRTDPAFGVAHADPDPRGMTVLGADGEAGGVVRDLWVDRSEMVFRYIEVEAANGRRVLVPMNFARVDHAKGLFNFLFGEIKDIRKGHVHVHALLGKHFNDIPGTKSPEQITRLEEERIFGYFGGGMLYATPQRQEPLL